MDRGGCHLRRTVAALLLVAGIALTAGAGSAAAAPYAWVGQGTSMDWSNATNWNPASPVTGATSLSFGTLLSAGCDPPTPAFACYHGTNNVAGLTVNAISIATDAYEINGDPVTLGSGGLTVTPGNGSVVTNFLVPITLSSGQTWTIDSDIELSPVTGVADPLTLDFSAGNCTIYVCQVFIYPGNSEVGTVNLNGHPGELLLDGGSLNGSDGNGVNVGSSATLYSEDHTDLGPLSNSGTVQIGEGTEGEVWTLNVNGTVALQGGGTLKMYLDDPHSTGADFSQLTATGNVTVGGSLSLTQSNPGSCHDLNPGDVYALISTSGSLSGTFSGLSNGSVITLANGCNQAAGATARINYTSDAVTATIVSGGHLTDPPQNISLPTISGVPRVGRTLSGFAGNWQGEGSSPFEDQWEDCSAAATGCTAIPGAGEAPTGIAAPTYRVTTADLGHRIVLHVSASNAFGTAGATSVATAVVEPPLPSRAEVHAALGKILKPTGKNAAIHRILKNGGYTFAFTAPSAGVLRLYWLVRPRGKTVFLARGTAKPTASGRVKFKLTLNRTGKRLLKHAERFGLRAYASFKPSGGPLRNAQKTFTLKR
jgi:hypothetical protein